MHQSLQCLDDAGVGNENAVAGSFPGAQLRQKVPDTLHQLRGPVDFVSSSPFSGRIGGLSVMLANVA